MNRTITRTITAVAGISLASISAISPAMAVSPDAGLFGSMDPTYDGVFRQSVAVLALAPLNKVPAESVTWLKSQQCLDGSFEEYRKSIRTACATPDPVKFTGADSNATALAVMALRAVKENPVRRFQRYWQSKTKMAAGATPSAVHQTLTQPVLS